ncbi:ParB/Srx family N-terminal domain-containing protein [Vibrio fluvialis]|uniref:ParB/Srx family N-terminal domain-containing protein n=1 Tax=Vibrio fluvialis TaxID=676 RepID=UPI0005CAD203|nr:ParB/Srx family N-terminal domain-containing protein [Vibrio fluvialis]
MERDIQFLPLNSIKLDQENVRFGGDIATSQREAIELMMADVEDVKKLVRLAEHIAENGLDPTELQLVYPDEDDSYVVIEGNRRLTALKMLQNPLLCPVEKFVRGFKDAQEKLNGNLPSEIACSVVPSRAHGNIWVELKHTGQNNGVGRVNWSSDIRDEVRSRATGVESVGRQIRTLVSENAKIFGSKTAENIKKIPVTTLTRLFASTPAQNAFKLKIENKLLIPSVDLKYIAPSVEFAISMFVQEGYNVNDIRGDKDRREFISHIPPELLPSKQEQSSGSLSQNGKGGSHNGSVNDSNGMNGSGNKDPLPESANGENSDAGPKDDAGSQGGGNGSQGNSKTISQRTTKARKYLYPWTLRIGNSRINEIYRELKSSLVVDKTPNAVAVTFRVFLETSCDDYTKRYEKSLTPVKKTDNQQPLVEKDPLWKKVVAVSAHLEQRQCIGNQEHRAILKRAGALDKVGSVDHLNLFVHSAASSPIASELKDVAEEYKPLLEAIWS